jgi:hypothetical protein
MMQERAYVPVRLIRRIELLAFLSALGPENAADKGAWQPIFNAFVSLGSNIMNAIDINYL